MMSNHVFDVAVVGMGPVGCVAAGLLGRWGLDVLILDKAQDIFALPRAAHIDHTGLRVLQQVGLLDPLIEEMIPNKSLDLVDADHELLVRVPGDQETISGLPASMYFYQPAFDRLLSSAVSAMPSVTALRGWEVVSLEAGESDVALECLALPGSRERVRARWVIGCDGAASTVRDLLGIEVTSLGFDEKWLVVDLRNTGEPSLAIDRAVQVCDPARPHVTNPIPGNRQRFEFRLFDDDDPPALMAPSSLRRLVRRWYPGGDFAVERSAVYNFHGLIATAWRSGRVFLAGDAAHQMPPFLGQGMCSGIRDAANLAWKMDFVLRGVASSSILDTYEAERSPHVRSIIERAIEFGRFVATTDPETARDRDARIRAGAAVMDSAASPGFRLPGLPKGQLVGPGGGSQFPQVIDASGRRLDDRDAGRLQLFIRDQPQVDSAADWCHESDWLSVSALDRLDGFRQGVKTWLDAQQCNFVVVRPDRYVMAAGDKLSELSADAIAAFGTSATHGGTAP
jgi:2-polyprenyl-6-methoxyphenol hydroxylase-like FAD-dependent oxidoreductase